MDLNKFDGKCVRIITTSGEVFEGVVSYDDREYALHEYGYDQDRKSTRLNSSHPTTSRMPSSA